LPVAALSLSSLLPRPFSLILILLLCSINAPVSVPVLIMLLFHRVHPRVGVAEAGKTEIVKNVRRSAIRMWTSDVRVKGFPLQFYKVRVQWFPSSFFFNSVIIIVINIIIITS
jgi:hypothetical protein